MMTGKRSGGSAQSAGASGESQSPRAGTSQVSGASTGGASGESRSSAPAGATLASGMTEESHGDDFRRVMDDAQEWIRGQMESSPYRTVLAAAGVGYLLGRGFASPIGKALLLGAGRFALMNAWNSGNLRESFDRVTGQASRA